MEVEHMNYIHLVHIIVINIQKKISLIIILMILVVTIQIHIQHQMVHLILQINIL